MARSFLQIGVDSREGVAGYRAFTTAQNRAIRSTREADKRIRDTDGSFKNFARTLSTARLVVAGFATSAAVLAAKRLFELGSAAEETASKFDTVFGGAVGSVNDFLDEFAIKAGLTIQQGQELTATAGAIAQGFGLSTRASAEFSEKIVRLAGDLASFHNRDIQDTFGAIRSGITGEIEPLRNLGIVIDATAAKQLALADTGKASVEALTQQDLALGRLKLILEKAGVAVGDLDRTQDSAANTARELEARFRNMADAVGTLLLPVFRGLLEELDDASDGFDDLSAKIKESATQVEIWVKQAQLANTVATVLATGFGDILQAARDAAPKIAELNRELDLLEAGFTEDPNLATVPDLRESERTLRTQQEITKEFQKRRDLLIEAVKLNVASGTEQRELIGIAKQYADVLDDPTASLAAQVDAARGLHDILSLIPDAIDDSTKAMERFVAEMERARFAFLGVAQQREDLFGFRDTAGLSRPNFQTQLPFQGTDQLISDEEVERLRQLAETFDDVGTEGGHLDEILLATIQPLSSLIDALFNLPGAARDAVRGVGDIAAAFSNLPDLLPTGPQGKLTVQGGLAAAIPSALGLGGGLLNLAAGLFGNLFGDNSAAARQLEAFVDALHKATNALHDDIAVRELVVKGLNDEADTLRFQLSQGRERTTFFGGIADTAGDPALIQRIQDAIAQGLRGSDLVNAIGDLPPFLAGASDEFLAAVQEYARLVDLQGEEFEAFVEAQKRQAEEEAARIAAQREAELRSFQDELALLSASVSGSDADVFRLQQQLAIRDEETRLRDLLEQGIISQNEFQVFLDLLGIQAQQAFDAFTKAAQDAADRLNQTDVQQAIEFLGLDINDPNVRDVIKATFGFGGLTDEEIRGLFASPIPDFLQVNPLTGLPIPGAFTELSPEQRDLNQRIIDFFNTVGTPDFGSDILGGGGQAQRRDRVTSAEITSVTSVQEQTALRLLDVSVSNLRANQLTAANSTRMVQLLGGQSLDASLGSVADQDDRATGVN